MNSALQHLRKDFQSMMGEEHLNVLSLVCIHRDIFLDYEKTIDIDVSNITFIVVICKSFCFASTN